jgi:glycine cleavage system H protein
MSAGLLSYKLCDRDFNCEQCPLDAALRGQAAPQTRRVAVGSPGELPHFFPEDRLYSPSHSWLQSIGDPDERLFRFGIDAFAATMIGSSRRVSWSEMDGERTAGPSVCEIDLGLGVLFVAPPIAAALVEKNEKLSSDANQLVTAPYGDGWIADLQVLDPTQLRRLLPAHAARECTRLDLRRFRRQVALQLLADTQDVGVCLADGGEFVDLRQMLAGPAYLELIRELIH